MINYDLYYLKFDGKYYDVGTIVLLEEFGKTYEAIYEGRKTINKYTCEIFNRIDENIPVFGGGYKILKILKPIPAPSEDELLHKQQEDAKRHLTGYPSQGTVDMAWMWYIVVMLLATIFKDRIFIWVASTIYFFWWKSKQL